MEINFLAEKTYVHRWPMDSPHWSKSFAENMDLHLNKNKEKKKVRIKGCDIKIDDYNFEELKKIGITVPLFKKETTMVFEGKAMGFYTHTHITTQAKNYLEIFNNLLIWKTSIFPDS